MKLKHIETFESLRKCPEMYVLRGDFASISSFIDGYNFACDGGPLCGFKEWLALRASCGFNWGWSSLVLHISGVGRDADLPLPPDVDVIATNAIFHLFSQFSRERVEPHGLGQIFAAYEQLRLSEIAE